MNTYAQSIDFSPLVSEVNSFFANNQRPEKNPALIYGKIKDVVSSNQFNSLQELASAHNLNVVAAYHSLVFGWLDSPNFCMNDYDSIIVPVQKTRTYNCNIFDLKPNAVPVYRPEVVNPVRTLYLSSMCNLKESVSANYPVFVKAGTIHNLRSTLETPDVGEFITLLLPAGHNENYFS